MSPGVRHALAAFAIATAAVVFTHVVACTVIHPPVASAAAEHPIRDHLPKAVLAVAPLLALAALGLRAVAQRGRHALELMAATVAPPAADPWPGRGPPEPDGSSVPLSVSLCVFRC